MKIETIAEMEHLMPCRVHNFDAGADLRTKEDIKIYPEEVTRVGTGVKCNIPHGYVGLLFSRSGHGLKCLTLANSVGVIDSGYQGEIVLLMVNRSDDIIHFKAGDRVGQLVIVPIVYPEFVRVTEFDAETERGEGGFGSTNAN